MVFFKYVSFVKLRGPPHYLCKRPRQCLPRERSRRGSEYFFFTMDNPTAGRIKNSNFQGINGMFQWNVAKINGLLIHDYQPLTVRHIAETI